MKQIFDAKIESLKSARAFVRKALSTYATTQKVIEIAEVVSEEILSNIINYGYCDSAKITDNFISLKVKKDNSQIFFLEFIDTGIPFNPVEYDFENKKRYIGGMGIKIVTCISKSMVYKRVSNQNILEIYIDGK